MKFGVMFFASNQNEAHDLNYEYLIDIAKFADENNFNSLWVPERHFHEFGSIFPNPPLIMAALSTCTNRIMLCAGSLISPLHHTMRLSENLAVVDILSNGRLGVSFGTGWNVNDFIFFPERYESKKEIMYKQINDIQKLWKGQSLVFKNTYDKDVEVVLYPKPVQDHLPSWVTISGNPLSYQQAGEQGLNILTHMIGQSINDLQLRIQNYKNAREANGFIRDGGEITLMLHTFIADSEDIVLKHARLPFREYIRSAVKLEGLAAQGGGTISGGHKVPDEAIPPDVIEELLDITFEKYYHNASLIGTPEKCQHFIYKLIEIGITEIACLVDFGISKSMIKTSLGNLNNMCRKHANNTNN